MVCLGALRSAPLSFLLFVFFWFFKNAPEATFLKNHMRALRARGVFGVRVGICVFWCFWRSCWYLCFLVFLAFVFVFVHVWARRVGRKTDKTII